MLTENDRSAPSPAATDRTCGRLAQVCAVVLGGASALVLVFRLSGIPTWFGVEGLAAAIGTWSALSLLLSSIGVWLSWRRRDARLALLLFALVGAVLALVQMGVDGVVTGAVPSDRAGAGGTAFAGLAMSSGGALAGALAIALMSGGARALAAARVLALGMLLVAVGALFRSAFAAADSVRSGHATSAALFEAMCVAVLATGLNCAAASRVEGTVLTDVSEGGKHVRRMLPAVFLVPLFLGLAAATALQAGLVTESVAAAVVSTITVIVVGALVYGTGLHLRSLDRARQQARIALVASEQLFRSSFENAFVGIAHVDVDGTIERANHRLAELLGYPEGGLPDRLFGVFASHESAALARTLESLRAGSLLEYRGEHRLLTALGIEVWGIVRITSQRRVSGDAIRFIVIVADVTERRQAQALLRVHQRAMHAAQHGIVIANARVPDWPIVDVNPAFERITGYRREEVIGTNGRFLNRLARDQESLGRIRTALDRSEACTEVLLNHRKDGVPIWLRLSLTPVLDEEGNVSHFVGIQEDITAAVRAEREREDLLAKALAERAAAERANRARDMLLAVVSHELRSPLNAVRLWASLLLADPSPNQVARSARQIEISVDAQSRLINDLIDISRIASGRLELHKELVECNAIAADTVESLQVSATEQSVELTNAMHPSPVVMSADRDRIGQAIRNLVENAIKFTPAGGRIVVATSREGDEARITVTDTGKGIEPEHVAQVFDRFWQADRRDTRSHGGLGLGLSIVKHIVERHGGRVEAASEGLGKGARFTLWFPLVKEEAAWHVNRTGTDEARAGEARGGDVLVVDDDVPTAEALALALRLRGTAVRTVHGVEEALAEIAIARPRILISDLMMPQRTGLQLMEEVRATERREGRSRVYAIAMTGRGDRTDRKRIRRAGFDAFLVKPVDIRSLMVRMEAAGEEPGSSPQRQSILVVDDHVDLATSLAERLRIDGHVVQVAHGVQDAREAARTLPPDVLITDMRLPDGRGDELANELSSEQVDLFTIAMTGSHVSMEDDVFDHVMQKPIHFEELAAVLRRVPRC